MFKIIIVQFDYDYSTVYKMLLDVLVYSITQHVKEGQIIIRHLEEPSDRQRVRGLVSNTYKLKAWIEEINKCEDGDRVLLIDCDMLIDKEIESVFDLDFDVAYTERDDSQFIINGGVIFAKINERSREFFHLLEQINNEMYKDINFHQKWRPKYAGMNQSALGYLIDKEGYKKERGVYDAKVLSLPCREWNVCSEWGERIGEGRIFHVKGQFRTSILKQEEDNLDMKKAVKLWRKYYHKSMNI